MSRSLRVSACLRALVALVALALVLVTWRVASAAPGASSSALPYPGSNAAKLSSGTTGVSTGGPHEPSLALVTPNGDPIVELEKRGGGYSADIVARNDGALPLEIASAVVRGDMFDVRAPENLEVRIGESAPGSAIVLPSGQLRHVVVTWAPGHTERIASFYAQLLVTSNDPTANVKAIGLHVQLDTPFSFVTAHPIAWLLLLPLLGAAFALYVQLSKKTDDDDALVHRVTLAFAGAQVAVAAWMALAFDPDLSRLDGNDGVQFAERGVLLRGLGIESFFAVDGMNLAPLVVVALTGLFALLALRSAESITAKPHLVRALVLILSSSTTGLFASFDAVIFAAFVALTGIASTLLLARAGVTMNRVRLFGMVWGAGFVVLALVIWTLRGHTDPNFAVDGTRVLHSALIPELARAAFVTKHAVALGAPLVKVATVGLVVACVLLMPFGPLASAMAAALAEAPAGVALAIGGSTFGVGGYGLLRVLALVLPEGTRWSAPAIAALGAFGLLYGCVAARGEADSARRSMTLAASLSAAVLVGLGALTAEGIRGALVAVVAPPLAAIVVALARPHVAAAPTATSKAVGAVARLVAAGALGPSSWCVFLVALGAFATSPIAAVVSIVAIAIAVAVTVAARPATVAASSATAMTQPETVPAAVFAAALLLLTVWPTPLFVAQGTMARRLVEVLDPPGPDQIAEREGDAGKFS